MVIATADECRSFVEAQLERIAQSHPGWHSSRSTEVGAPPLSWTLGNGTGWYLLEARLTDREFLIWFGNHQVGAGGLHWIVRPAVHLAFADLEPRNDPIGLHYTLSDVLEYMIQTLSAPNVLVSRFEVNTFSLT